MKVSQIRVRVLIFQINFEDAIQYDEVYKDGNMFGEDRQEHSDGFETGKYKCESIESRIFLRTDTERQRVSGKYYKLCTNV